MIWIWYMGCDCKFYNFFQFYHHRRTYQIILSMFIVVIRQSIFPFNFWFMYENCYFRLKKNPYISWYCAIFAFCFGTGNKLSLSATAADTSRYVNWSVIIPNYIEKLNRYILTKGIYMDNGQLELCPSFIRIWGFPFQRLKNAILLLI